MPTLSTDFRNKLERTVIAARDAAEGGAKVALESLAVHHHEPYPHMKPAQRELRNKLRARARQLGDAQAAKGLLSINHLGQECAYEHWHRMLFARFLAENHLLIEPEMGVAVSLDEVKELAKDAKTNLWELAGRFAQTMLPEIFRADDPVLHVPLAREDQLKLEQLLDALVKDTFTAGDSLGWCYQFWQAKRKDEVNAAGNKIGANELPSVTQLFTEDYMVDFLLDNTLGAWWAGKKLTAENAKNAEFKTEEEVRQFCALPGCPWKYLRFIKGKDGKWTPAAGMFDGWPKTAKELKCLDPCMGSGHFVVAMFERLVALRMAEEKLDEAAAVAAVIRENLFGLEIDPRCTQIAAFNLALAAWRRVGHRPLPAMNLACSGLAPNTREADWLALAGDNEKLQNGMKRLYRLFKDAPVLGSLINPRADEDGLFVAAFHELQPLLEKALEVEEASSLSTKGKVAAASVAAASSRRESLDASATFAPTNYFQPNEPVAHLTGDLPHWRQPGTTYFVTFRCADALPQEKLHQWQKELAAWHAAHPEPHDETTRREFYEHFPKRIQTWLDAGYGKCLLRESAMREIVESAIRHFDGQRYRLQEFVVAANHVHALVTPLDEHRLSDILHSWKSFAANKINKAQGKSGTFWQKESFDHIVRSPASLAKFREYILAHQVQRLEASATVAAASSRGGLKGKRLEGSVTVAAASSRRGLNGKSLEGSATLHEMAVTARGLAKAAEILAGQFTLVATNVPYLARTRHPPELCEYADNHYPEARTDLAMIFVARCIEFSRSENSIALVTPQNWNFQDQYESFRSWILRHSSLQTNIQLGPSAFDAISGEVVKPALVIATRTQPVSSQMFLAGDLSELSGAAAKGKALMKIGFRVLLQSEQFKNPRSRVLVTEMECLPLLNSFAGFHNGICSGDMHRFTRCFWELNEFSDGWATQQTTTCETREFSGMHNVFWWQNGSGDFYRFACERLETDNPGAWIRGKGAWCKKGVLVSAMGRLQVSRYLGDLFDDNTVALVPVNEKNLPALWEFCSSSKYAPAVRQIDQSLKVRGPLVEVPFDLAHWQKVAAEKYPHGLPKPFSSDPTQWLFDGHPYVTRASRSGSEQQQTNPDRDGLATLHVAVARLLGYLWPRQTGSSFPDCPALEPDGLEKLADDDGIVCIPSVRGEEPAAERLRKVLAAAFGKDWKAQTEAELIRAGGSEAGDFDEWLRNDFFEQHCKLFHDRPFVWHLWDGRKRDGFHALVNYHKLCEDKGKGRKVIESLTYSYLGEWITRQKDGVKRGEGGAEDRLAAALELQKRLEAILAGEPPFDIFVRWKPLAKQAIGWEPDINDGVRMNIRPFLASDLPGGKKGAGILRYKPNIKWDKDRGKEPERSKAEYPWFWGWDEQTENFMGGKTFDGNRWNNCHYTNKVKQAAREAAGKGKQ
jgi:REP element-mobilizing transposase RayT